MLNFNKNAETKMKKEEKKEKPGTRVLNPAQTLKTEWETDAAPTA